MEFTLSSTLPLNHGGPIPVLGLGVFRTGAGQATIDAVRWALEAGYRHVDTAAVYRNEREVGEGLRRSGLDRNDVFVTTKLWRDDVGYDATRRAFDRSLAALGLDYVDLYLMHWPFATGRAESWRAMEALVDEGRARAIGVSNYTTRHLDELLARARIAPAVNQVELHPFLQQHALVAYCRAHGIVLEAWGPLTKGLRLGEPALVAVGGEVGRTPAQVLVRWSLQHGFVVLPKSSREARIVDNAAVFDFALTASQMARIDALEENFRTAPGWDPTTAP